LVQAKVRLADVAYNDFEVVGREGAETPEQSRIPAVENGL